MRILIKALFGVAEANFAQQGQYLLLAYGSAALSGADAEFRQPGRRSFVPGSGSSPGPAGPD